MITWRDTLISPETPIIKAIKILNEVSSQILLITDSDDRLLGTLTDGDFRRAILAGKSLEASVIEIANASPKTLDASSSDEAILQVMKTFQIHHIPLLDDNHKVVGVAGLNAPQIANEVLLNTAVIMAGGKGSRLYPLTKDTPKPMLELAGRPILELIVENLVKNGIRKIVISVNYLADVIVDHFADGRGFGAHISYIHEIKPLGTAGSLGLLAKIPSRPIIVMNGDVLTQINFANMLKEHNESGMAVTMAVHRVQNQVPYGVVEIMDGKVKHIKEKPVESYLVNSGIYVMNPNVLRSVHLDQKIDMPDLLTKLHSDGHDTGVFAVHEYWLDIGRPDELDRARNDHA